MILIFWSFFLGVQSLDNEALLSNINTSQRFSSIDIYPQSFRLLEQTTFPIGLSPICIAYKNFPSSMPTSISMDEIAALLTLNPHVPSGWENVSVGVPSAGSGAGYALLSSLAAYGVGGGFVQGRDKGEYPSSVQTNPQVTIHSDVESVLKWFDSRQTPSITFLSNFVTIQRAISCLSVRVLIDVSPRILLTSISLNDTLQLARLAVDEYPLVSVLMYVAPRAQFCLPDNPIERLLGDTGITSNLITYGGNRFTPQTQYLVYKHIASYQCLSKPTLYGVGSSAIYPFIVNAFFDTLSKATSYLSYSPIGSGAGLTQLKSGAVLLAISDIPLSSSDQTDFPNLQMIPAVAFSVSIVYNLGDTVQLNIPACVVGDIFRGTVEYWDDDVLQRANPTAHLPHQRILVVVRSDSSGTTETFLNGLQYLSQLCKLPYNVTVSSRWTLGSKVVNASGSQLAQTIASTMYSIGYLATPDVTASMSTASIWSATQVFDISTTSLRRDFVRFTLNPLSLELQFPTNITVYPFIGVSYFIVEKVSSSRCDDRRRAAEFIQNINSIQLHYPFGFVSLSDQQSAIVIRTVRTLTCNGVSILPSYAWYYDSSRLNTIVIAMTVLTIFILICSVGTIDFSRIRNQLYSPPDSTQPVAVVFTDIQGFSTLWARIPEVMGSIQDMHLALMRNSIAKFSGYEARHTGESFMVVFRNAHDAVMFALDVQIQFYEFDWETSLLDEVYQSISPHDLTSAEYRRLWNGLRIRIGIDYGAVVVHQGKGEPSYSGITVDTAASTQLVGHGGQIVTTIAVWEQTVIDESILFHELGRHPLPHVGKEVTLFQIAPERLGDREFPPLRLCQSIISPNKSYTETSVSLMLSALPLKDRSTVLKTLCSKWRISYTGRAIREDMAAATQLLCRKVEKSANMKENSIHLM